MEVRHATLGPTVRGAEATPEHDADDLRSLVTVTREHPSDSRDRQIFVRIDQAARIALVYGESMTIELVPGLHTLHAHNTLFWRRIPFAIEAGEHLEFSVINETRWWTFGMAGILGTAPVFLKVQRRSLV